MAAPIKYEFEDEYRGVMFRLDLDAGELGKDAQPQDDKPYTFGFKVFERDPDKIYGGGLMWGTQRVMIDWVRQYIDHLRAVRWRLSSMHREPDAR